MELFIPGLLVFFVVIAISFLVIPRFTPLLAAILSIVFLTLGVRQHYMMFASEYRLSTWQESLKIYAPAIMIGAIILFIIYSILALFTKGSVPVPSMPNITAPNENTVTDNVLESLNTAANSLANINANLEENVNEAINTVNENATKFLNNITGNNNKNKNKNKNENNLSRSFLETI
jgi:hypothetical protein